MTHLVVSDGLAPPLDEGGAASTARYVDSLSGRVILVNRSRAAYSPPGVRTIRVPTGSTPLAKSISFVAFALVSVATAALARPDRVRHFPLRPPGPRSQALALALSLVSRQFDQVLFQVGHVSGLTRRLSRFRIAAVSDHDRAKLAEAGVRAERVEVMPAAPRRSTYDRVGLRASFGLRRDSFVVAHVGHLTPKRGLDFLVRLAGQRPEIEVLLLLSSRGWGSLPSSPRNFHVIDRFIPDVYEVYACSDAYAFPLRAEAGAVSTPLSLLEARRAGLPVLCSDLPNLRETLRGYDRVCFVDMNREDSALIRAAAFIDDLRARDV